MSEHKEGKVVKERWFHDDAKTKLAKEWYDDGTWGVMFDKKGKVDAEGKESRQSVFVYVDPELRAQRKRKKQNHVTMEVCVRPVRGSDLTIAALVGSPGALTGGPYRAWRSGSKTCPEKKGTISSAVFSC